MTRGEIIRCVRRTRDMTQKTLARAPGLTESAVRLYELDAKVPTDEHIKVIARSLSLMPGEIVDGGDVARRLSRPDDELMSLARQFENGCGLRPYLALAALETCAVANEPSVMEQGRTAFVPPMPRPNCTEWKKDRQRIRFLAGFSALFRYELTKAGTLRSLIASPEFERSLHESAYLQDVKEYDVSELTEFRTLAELYTAYLKIGVDNAVNLEYMAPSDIDALIYKTMSGTA